MNMGMPRTYLGGSVPILVGGGRGSPDGGPRSSQADGGLRGAHPGIGTLLQIARRS